MLEMIESVLKNLFSKSATNLYPFVKKEQYENVRGQISGIDINDCIFCGICQRKCPPNAIVVDKTEKSWELDPFKCIICGVCVEICPKKCIKMDKNHKTSVYTKDKNKFTQKS